MQTGDRIRITADRSTLNGETGTVTAVAQRVPLRDESESTVECQVTVDCEVPIAGRSGWWFRDYELTKLDD